MEMWDVAKYVGAVILVPFITYLIRSVLNRLDKLEHNDGEQDKEIAVLKSQMKRLQGDIKEIKDGVNKLLDHLLNAK